MLLLNIQNTCIQLIASIRTGGEPPVCTCKDTNKTGTSKEKNAKKCKTLTDREIKTLKTLISQKHSDLRNSSTAPHIQFPRKIHGKDLPPPHVTRHIRPSTKKLLHVTYCKPIRPNKKQKKIEKIFCRNEKRLYFCTRFPPEETTTGNKRNLK